MTPRTTPRSNRRRSALVATSVLASSLVGGFVLPESPAAAEPLGASERFVRQAYVDVVRDADPDQAEIDAALAALAGGQSPAVWLWNLLQSPEGRGAFVDSEFARLLDRPVDPAGRAFYIAKLERGATRANLRAFLVGSNEYFQRKGGTNEAFVDAAFQDLLGRAPDEAGRTYWIGKLESGTTRTQLANTFQQSSEGRRLRVRLIFATYLDRLPDPSGLAYWMQKLASGSSEERVITTISGGTEYARLAGRVPEAEKVVLLTEANSLIIRTPGAADVTRAVVGVNAGTTLVGIDVRPATGVLYGLGSDGQLYAINVSTGTADEVGAPIASFDASAGVGFDFNPVADALRVVTGAENYRLNATTGAVVGEGPGGSGTPGALTYAPGDVNEGAAPTASGAAYTQSSRGLPAPAATALFDIDAATDSLVRQNPANAGTLLTIGSLLLDASGVSGFDVSPDGSQAAYAVLTTERGQGLYAVNLANGEPKLIEHLDGPRITGLAVLGTEAVVPTEAAFGLSADGLSLVSFTTTDATVSATQVVTGQNAGTSLVAIDVRPSTGQLFALGSDGQLYTVDTSVPAVATVARANPFGPKVGFGELDLSQGVGFDVNPAADRIRITVGDKNYRLQTNGVIDGEGPPNTGLPGTIQYVAGDPGAGTTPKVTGAAYTNSYRSATPPTATALFDLEVNRDVLVRQNPANAGDLTTIGPMGVDATGVDGFDISGGPGQTAYAVMTVGGAPGLYRVDLATGAATLVGALPAGLQGLAIK
ncbi:MAG: DUF4394 domain-containing protein [Aquihabitans sp.]